MTKLSRPLHLLLAALTYTLGASIPSYLGRTFLAAPFFLGLAGALCAQWSMSLLAEVFRPHNEPLLDGETPSEKEKVRSQALSLAIAALAICAVTAFLLHRSGVLLAPAISFLFISLLLILAYSVPPFRLMDRGYGELALAIHLAYVLPSIGFLLQVRDNHRLLPLMLLPLTALALAYFLVQDFISFPSDQKYQRATLLRLLTWERAVPFHHSLLALAYLIFAAGPVLGFSILWPALLTLPFAILQVLLLRHVSLGGKPNWTLLNVTALAVFGLTTYFLTLPFWLK